MKKTKSIVLEKKYEFPKEVSEVFHRGKWLIISPATLNWLVLSNDQQVAFYHLLRDFNIGDAINNAKIETQDVQNVLIQIEAKDFCTDKVTDKRQHNEEHMQFFLTNACNLRCPHCYMFAGCKDENELSYGEVITSLRAFVDNGGRKVTFSGGEVKVREDFCRILKFCKAKGLYTQVFTNGTMWTEDELDRSNMNNWLNLIDEVQISIDGYSEESNALTRGAGHYYQSMRCVDLFVLAGVKTEVAVTPIMSADLKVHISNYIQWGRALLEQYKGHKFGIKFSGELLEGRDISLDKSEQNEYGHIMDTIYKGVYGSDVAETSFASFVLQKQRLHGCSFGSFNVAANGDIYMCGRISGMQPIANVRSCSYEQVFQQVQKALKMSDVDNLKPCGTCELRFFCGGECRVKYFKEFASGADFLDLDKVSPRVCSQDIKARFYDLMIDSDCLLFQ